MCRKSFRIRLTQKFWKPLKDHAAFRCKNLERFFSIWILWHLAAKYGTLSDAGDRERARCWFRWQFKLWFSWLLIWLFKFGFRWLFRWSFRRLFRWLFRCSLIVWFRLIRSFNLVWRSGGVGRASWGRGKILQQVHLQTHL